MHINLSKFINPQERIAVALSGGIDSMALLYYMKDAQKKFNFSLLAINVEHGIRGNDSILDSEFVKEVCFKQGIPLLSYSVNATQKAHNEKLSIEESARILRYQCFYDAINNGKCDKVATAHHKEDNVESVLLNLFRGTGTKGLIGIADNFDNKIIRPLLSVSKDEIIRYTKDNNIQFVTDKTNFSDEYTRNYLRLNVIPEIKKVFPKVTDSIARLCEIASIENDYMDKIADNALKITPNGVEINLPIHRAVFMRASIKAIKILGIEKDWEHVHLSDAYSLTEKINGAKINLPKGICAVKEYDKIVFYKQTDSCVCEQNFAIGKVSLGTHKLNITRVSNLNPTLEMGLFGDLDKIPQNAIIRYRQKGDLFKKFGGGTKSLGDYLTDKKIPLRKRDSIPLLACKNQVLCIFGIGISDDIKIDNDTKNIIQFIIE